MARPWNSRRRWAEVRDTIAARVRAAVGTDGLLAQAYGQRSPRSDTAALMAVIVGLLDPDEECARRLVRRTIDALDAYPFLYRYPPEDTDGFAGLSGRPLAVCTRRGAAAATMGRFGLWTWRIERYLNLRLRG